LLEEALEVPLQERLLAPQRFEDADRGQLNRRGRRRGSRFESPGSSDDEKEVYRAGDQADERNDEERRNDHGWNKDLAQTLTTPSALIKRRAATPPSEGGEMCAGFPSLAKEGWLRDVLSAQTGW